MRNSINWKNMYLCSHKKSGLLMLFLQPQKKGRKVRTPQGCIADNIRP